MPVKRGVRVAEEGAGFIRNGSSVPIPGVTYVSQEIETGDSVFALDIAESCVTDGVAVGGGSGDFSEVFFNKL